MGRKKEVAKPRTDLYITILNIMQSMAYTPKPLSWFLCELNAKLDELRHAMQYLEYYHYIRKEQNETYVVCADIRVKVRGKYYAQADGSGYVEVDAQRMIEQRIYIPERWRLGAQHNDRVAVAIEGIYQSQASHKQYGAIEEIIQPYGDYFCGTLRYMDKKWYVVPRDKHFGLAIRVQDSQPGTRSGSMVYACLSNAVQIRKAAFDAADVRQKQKTIVWDQIRSSTPCLKTETFEKTCRIVCSIDNPVQAYAYENRLHGLFSNQAMRDAAHPRKQRGKPADRMDLTKLQSYRVLPDRAHSVIKEENGFRIYTHVPDVTSYVPEGSALDRELQSKGMLHFMLPRVLRKACGFRIGQPQDAITVEFVMDQGGQLTWRNMYRSVIQCGKSKPVYYEEARKNIRRGNILTQDPLQYATEFAVMDYFEEADFPAPFINLYQKRDGGWIQEAAQTLDLNMLDAVLNQQFASLAQSAKRPLREAAVRNFERLVREVPDWLCRGAFSKVDFCQPFTSYLSILTQRAFVMKQKGLTRQSLADFAQQMQEATAIFLWQREASFYYQIMTRNQQLQKRYIRNPKHEIAAIVIGSPGSNNNGGYIFCDGIPAFCTDLNSAHFKIGDRIFVRFDHMGRTGIWMYYRRSAPPKEPCRSLLYDQTDKL